jgi:hypothetical protein
MPGTSVSISGTGFNSVSSVAFNGSNASFTVNSPTQLTATVPSGATSGAITVTTPGGTGTSSNSFTVLTAIEAWRQQWFGTTGNTGNAADDADPNNNGIFDLLEYALGGDPSGNTTGTSVLPQISRSGTNRLQLTFTRSLDRNDITLTAQALDALTATWEDLAQSVNGSSFTLINGSAGVSESGTGNTRTVTVQDIYLLNDPAHPHRFMRLKVTRP